MPTIQTQNVAEHSYHVAWIADWLLSELEAITDGLCLPTRAEVLLAALIHDESESLSGDVATPYKRGAIGQAIREHEARHKLGLEWHSSNTSEDVRSLVKVADSLEALLFLHEEMALGNHRVSEVADEIRTRADIAWNSLSGECRSISARFLNQMAGPLPAVELSRVEDAGHG